MSGVAVMPGATTWTRMFRGAHSIPAPLAGMMRPPSAAEHRTSFGLPTMLLMIASPLHCSADHLDLDRGVEG
jgi:hypothetical protein